MAKQETTEVKVDNETLSQEVYKEGTKVKMRERVEVECIKTTSTGMVKGRKYKMHPLVAEQFRLRKIVK